MLVRSASVDDDWRVSESPLRPLGESTLLVVAVVVIASPSASAELHRVLEKLHFGVGWRDGD